MVQQAIRGSTQIIANTVTSGQVNSSIIVAGGGNAFSGNQSHGGFLINSLGSGVASTDAVNLGQVQALIEGIQSKVGVRCATNTESLTISAGNATGITGLTIDGVTLAIGDLVLVPNAPASTGACGGAVLSSQPANGVYTVTGITTNATMVRAPEMGGTLLGGTLIPPFGTYVYVVAGTLWSTAGFAVTTPSTQAAFTYGTGNNIAFTQWSGLGEITVDTTLTKTGNQLSRPALTGDVTASTGSNATTISAAAVTLAKMANLSANSVIGNNTAGSTTPVAVPLSVAAGTPAASTIPLWDANKNLLANVFAVGVTSTATAGSSTTLTVSTAAGLMVWTGSTTQTVLLPTTGVVAGAQYSFINQSTGILTIQSSGANAITTLAGAASAPFNALIATALVATPTTAANWAYTLYSTGGGGSVSSVSVASSNGFAGTSSGGATPALTLTTTVASGLVGSNGTALQAATGANITAHLSQNEVPSGLINSSNAVYGLAHTQVTNSEQVFLNGLLQRGLGTDYTATAATITFVTAPTTGDNLLVSYWF